MKLEELKSSEPRSLQAFHEQQALPEIQDPGSAVQRLKAWLEWVDEAYCSWADTKSGQAIAMVAIVALVAVLAYPAAHERLSIYQQGYEQGRKE